MYNYIKGEITEIQTSHITLETHGIGYLVKVPNPYLFNLNEEYLVYIHHYIKEDINELFGFLSKTEKSIFEKLLTVKGLGPKIALMILKHSKADEILTAVDESNTSFFKNFTGIGTKLSQQIILDLKGKLEKPTDERIPQITTALKSLGYNQTEIISALKHINLNNETTIQDAIKQALKLIKS